MPSCLLAFLPHFISEVASAQPTILPTGAANRFHLHINGRLKLSRPIAAVESKTEKLYFLSCHAPNNLELGFLTHPFFEPLSYCG